MKIPKGTFTLNDPTTTYDIEKWITRISRDTITQNLDWALPTTVKSILMRVLRDYDSKIVMEVVSEKFPQYKDILNKLLVLK